jgi:hypothetical protein
MTTLQDAWLWYVAIRQQLGLMERLAAHYWHDLPWEGRLSRDDYFKPLEAQDLHRQARFGLSQIDDQAIVLLFSVFESLVRRRVLDEIDREAAHLRHRALRQAWKEAREQIAEGSFFHVLQPFKDYHADLVEEVNQVRRYRNWVAHGKGGQRPPSVDPRTAFNRLQRFLSILDAEGEPA